MSTFLISATATPAAWTFTQGFLVGQGAFILLCLLFVRYVVFSPADAQDPDAWRQRREERSKVSLGRPVHRLTDVEGAPLNNGCSPTPDWPSAGDSRLRHVDAPR